MFVQIPLMFQESLLVIAKNLLEDISKQISLLNKTTCVRVHVCGCACACFKLYITCRVGVFGAIEKFSSLVITTSL